jgi:DNA-binding NarL/FixJ family response regulator
VIRILLADDHPVVREGLVSILKAKDIKVIGEASDGEEACRLYDQVSPDILILDLRMPKKNGLQVVTEHTVKAHVKSILAKLDAIGRTEAIAIAIKRGIIEER